MDQEHDDGMEQIKFALDTAPEVAVPDDFAARVMTRLPAQGRRRLTVPALPMKWQFGRFAVIAAMLVLVGAMLVLAPLSRNSSSWYNVQVLLLLQLAALVLVFGRALRGMR